MIQAIRRPSISRPAFVVLCAVSAIPSVGFGGLQSVLPAIGRQIGIADSLVAVVFSLAALLTLICAPLWGRQADRRGRKVIMLVGVLGFVLSMVGCGLVVSAGIHRMAPPLGVFVLFLLARGVSGAIGSASPPATQAFVADHTDPAERTRAIATLAGAAGFGSIFGPLVTPLLAQGPLGLAGPLYAFAVAGAVLVALIGRFVPRDPRSPVADGRRRDTVKLREIWNNPVTRRLLICSALINVYFVGVTQTIGFTLIDSLVLSPIKALPYITGAMMAGASATVFGQWGLVRWFRMEPRGLIGWGAGGAALGSLVIIASDNYRLIVIGYAVLCLGLSLARPGIASGASLAVDARGQATVAGLMAAMLGGAPLVSPLFLVLYTWTRPAPFLLGAALLSAILVYALADRQLRDIRPPA